MSKKQIEADLARWNEVLEEYVNGKLGVALPADCPCYVRFWRIVEENEESRRPSRSLKAVVLELDLLFHGIKIYLRFGHDDGGKVKLMTELAGERELLAEWVRENA